MTMINIPGELYQVLFFLIEVLIIIFFIIVCFCPSDSGYKGCKRFCKTNFFPTLLILIKLISNIITDIPRCWVRAISVEIFIVAISWITFLMNIYPRNTVHKLMFIVKVLKASFCLFSVYTAYKASKILIFIICQIFTSLIFFLVFIICFVRITETIREISVFKEKIAMIVGNTACYFF